MRAGLAGVCSLGCAATLGCGQPPAPVETPEDQAARRGFVRPARSPWFTPLDGDAVRCELCPKRCELATGARAVCGVRENRDGVGYTLAFGNPALIQEDPVERKPFFHVVPGSRALSVATAGCNLACKFCEVWDIALVAPEEVHAYDMPPEAVLAHARAAGVRAVSCAFGEPVVFLEYAMAIGALAKEAGLLNLMHTAGYIQPEPLREMAGLLDAVVVDLKGFDPAFYHEVVGGELEPVLRTLVLLKTAGVHIEITNLVIPTLNDDMHDIGRMCEWIAGELGTGVPIHFARFYPLYKLSDLPRTPVSTLDRARDTARAAGLRFVYIARVTGHEGENTFCPNCGRTIVRRVGFVIEEVRIADGCCGHCGTSIPGKWS